MQRIPTLRVIYFRSTKTQNFQFFCQFLKKVAVTDCFDGVVILPKTMDCFFFFVKNGVLVKACEFFRTGEKLENFNQNQNDRFLSVKVNV